MAKFPTRRETQEWRKKLVGELALEFPDLREEDEDRFKAALGARVEKDPEARTMVYAVFLDHVMSEMPKPRTAKKKSKSKPGPRTAKKKSKSKKK